ncbi:hypothetical protein [Streptomyces sp. NPDC020951]|uniref:hypothetical protein n=1 Tax=Streptomyces sp. NPDC020951 TaxID=3365104 RepID=UPI0037B3E775
MPDMSASVSLAMTHLVPLAKEVDENKVTPGVLGFIVFAAMAVAVWALMKSMNKHMGKVDFNEPTGPDETSGKGAPASAPSTAPTTGKPSSAT